MASFSTGMTSLRNMSSCINARSQGCIRSIRYLHTTQSTPANPLPITQQGPPPKPPIPLAPQYEEKVLRRKRQAELLKQGKALRAAEQKPGNAARRRFWKDVHVVEVPEGLQIHLDTRPIRTPSKSVLIIPRSKPHLAAAIALEWDLLTSAQQALKQHLIPLTSLASRAQNLQEEEQQTQDKSRKDIVDTVMRYLDTDTMLCWAPETSSTSHAAPGLEHQTQTTEGKKMESLRDIQIKTAMPIVSYLTTYVWPGVEIRPVTDSNSIVPVSQEQGTKDVIRGWLMELPAWELAGLERAVLAGKGLLAAARLIVEWSPKWSHLRGDDSRDRGRFGIHEATEAASLEVRWQTDMWGEVEDTHDVEKEDLRRQLGSVIVLLSGSQRQ